MRLGLAPRKTGYKILYNRTTPPLSPLSPVYPKQMTEKGFPDNTNPFPHSSWLRGSPAQAEFPGSLPMAPPHPTLPTNSLFQKFGKALSPAVIGWPIVERWVKIKTDVCPSSFLCPTKQMTLSKSLNFSEPQFSHQDCHKAIMR